MQPVPAELDPLGPSDPPRRFVQLPGGPLAYTDEGSGPVVLAVHGLPGSGRDFRWLSPWLSYRLAGRLSRAVRVIRVDLPGFGRSPVAAGPDPSPTGRAAAVIALSRRLSLDRPLILGHSMGGLVAVAAVTQAPSEFSGLALVSSPGLRAHASLRQLPLPLVRRILSRPAMVALLRPFTRWIFARAGFVGYPDAALSRTLECVVATSLDAHAARVADLDLPTLVAWCDDDPQIEADILAELAQVCPAGPRLHFATGGHNPQKTHARELSEELTCWMVSLGMVKSRSGGIDPRP